MDTSAKLLNLHLMPIKIILLQVSPQKCGIIPVRCQLTAWEFKSSFVNRRRRFILWLKISKRSLLHLSCDYFPVLPRPDPVTDIEIGNFAYDQGSYGDKLLLTASWKASLGKLTLLFFTYLFCNESNEKMNDRRTDTHTYTYTHTDR